MNKPRKSRATRAHVLPKFEIANPGVPSDKLLDALATWLLDLVESEGSEDTKQAGQRSPTLHGGRVHQDETNDGAIQPTRKQRSLSLTQLRKLFDGTPSDNVERRTAVAECMGLTLQQAVNESRNRTRQ